MHKLEEGILEPSRILFLTPSRFAADTLYYLQHLGVFHCDARYRATHPYWESALILFMEEGELQVTCRQETRTAAKGDIVLIDCRDAHEYRALGDVRFHYFHFWGVTCAGYIGMLYENTGRFVLGGADSPVLDSQFQALCRLARAQAGAQNEQRISICIQMILSELTASASTVPPGTNRAIGDAVRFMEEHLQEKLSVDEIAAHVGFNKHYFSRCFKKYTGTPLHQYFLNMKIQRARSLLMTTGSSVEEISGQCGFENVSNFIRAFRQVSGMTPSRFRRIPL